MLQVDRLSKLTETPVDDMNETKRLQIINSTVNVDKRLVKLFELIETDLLAKIVHSTQTIAPYKVSHPCAQFFWAVESVRDDKMHASMLLQLILAHVFS